LSNFHVYILFYKIICKPKNILKILLGRTCADRGTKTIAVQDGQKKQKQACASFVSEDIDRILLKHYFVNKYNTLYNYFKSIQDRNTMKNREGKQKCEIKIQ